ncbi:nitric oxide-associated protein 1 [Orussus abietinus]|uniref:nitric oxide-associated protein 1 n=1 Tax=Orussus abietinus TaxID=222816 RepID=UPI0006255A1A|nr:nitric oxide-associated protein 1 [Orussus abietinus]
MLFIRKGLRIAQCYSGRCKCNTSKLQNELRLCQTNNERTSRVLHYSTARKVERDSEFLVHELDPRVERIKDKLLYSDYVESKKLKFGFRQNKAFLNRLRAEKEKKKLQELRYKPVLSVTLENMTGGDINVPLKSAFDETVTVPSSNDNAKPVHMPYATSDQYQTIEPVEAPIEPEGLQKHDDSSPLNKKYKILYEKYLELTDVENTKSNKMKNGRTAAIAHTLRERLMDDASMAPDDWLSDYDHYVEPMDSDGSCGLNYGTPDPKSKVSSVPCGGCGALLHCKDIAIPGYIPSELFKGQSKNVLRSITCQRCHFMKNYNIALDVKVSPEEYPNLLKVIKGKKTAVILMIDLMDFPCSIWPDIVSIIGHKTPIFVVGNKVDLLPRDSPNCLEHVKKCIVQSMKNIGINKANIKHIALISAKTGYGIEELINKLHKIWEYTGDVYLVGCTNVGKSSLFNALIQSDYCKVQAIDLVQRATISPWPGTTLNLLKFPILNPLDWRLYKRTMRLTSLAKFKHAEESYRRLQFIESKNLDYATLQGDVGRTFRPKRVLQNADAFAVEPYRENMTTRGINEKQSIYALSRWCYDTPGTVQPDQVIHLLTTDELMQMLPTSIISPRTFLLKPGQTLFLAGLGRLDYVDGGPFIRCTVFANNTLPINICYTANANDIYKELLPVPDALVIPINDPERLKIWPDLAPKDLTVTGIDLRESAADVLLSSAGWIAITPDYSQRVTLKAWTPEGRGIYLRSPALLRKSVILRGARRKSSPVYKHGWRVYRKP